MDSRKMYPCNAPGWFRARERGGPIFLARHVGPAGWPIEPGSPLTDLIPALALTGEEFIFGKRRPSAFVQTHLADPLREIGFTLPISSAIDLMTVIDRCSSLRFRFAPFLKII
ncbi:isochorismatase family protein [Pseudomonas sp. NPDC088368]|jgi:hypothetical protein|uniref:isochorismatase family protein n=1 Tax=Pseudomonas sp. NPDC088368 TaxID=3364453 RepID=UPI00382E2C7F